MIGNAVHVMRIATGEIVEEVKAMAAGITDRLWDMREIAEMVEATLPKAGRPATYKKRGAEISS